MSLFRKQSVTISQASRSSRRYRESTHLIPTPGVERHRPERYNPVGLNTWLVFGLAGIMILCGVGIEIALAISQRNQGFPIPAKNVFTFVRTSFLTSFFPTLLILPLGYFWGVVDRALRWYQPYVALSRGNVSAEESLMVDFIMPNFFVTFFKSFKRGEWIVFLSMVTAILKAFYQPLAGGLLSVTPVNRVQPMTLTGSFGLGLDPNVKALNAFLAAAGFTEAAAFQELPDPPFVSKGWAVAPFPTITNPGINASLTLNTTGISTSPNCYVPTNVNLDTNNTVNYTISAVNADRCSATVAFNPDSADEQYGTAPADPASCGLPADTDTDFAPVMFWYYQSQPRRARAIICRPSIGIFNVQAKVNLNNNSVAEVVVFDSYTAPNSVSGGTLNGKAYNAVQFNLTQVNDFVKARAIAVSSQIPGAIFRFASQTPTSLEEAFATPNGFLNLTKDIYTQHLSVTAKSIYFINTNTTLPALKDAQVPRLIVDILAAHALSSLLFTVGTIGIIIHIMHIRKRRNLYLTTAPGTVASAVALTSHSGFGELLFPYDDENTIRAKLSHLRFSLDRRTGAIVADEYAYDEGGFSGEHYDGRVSDAEKMPLREANPMRDVQEAASSEGGHLRPVSAASHTPSASYTPSATVHELPYEHEPLVLDSDRVATPPPQPHGAPGTST